MTFYAWIRKCLLWEASHFQLPNERLKEVKRSVIVFGKEGFVGGHQALPDGRASGTGNIGDGNTESHLFSLPEDDETRR